MVENLDVAAVNNNAALSCLNLFIVYSHDRVILEQVGQGFIIGKVVDADNLDIGKGFIFAGGPEDGPADPAKSVDAYFDSHNPISSPRQLKNIPGLAL